MLSPALPTQRIRTSASLIIAGFLVFLMYQLLQPFLIPLVSGGVIALICRPLYRRVQRRLKLKSLSSVVTILLFIIVVLTPLIIIGALVVREISGLTWTVHNPSYSFYHFNHLLDPYITRLGFSPDALNIDIKSYLQEGVRFVGDRSTMLIGGALGALASVALTLLGTFYIMSSHDDIRRIVTAFSPLNPDDTTLLWERTKNVIRAAVSGNLILVVIEAVLSMIGFSLFGLISPVLLGLCFGVTSLVPVIGSSMIWVPIVLFEILQGNLVAASGIALWSICQVGLCDYYLGPHLIEKRAQLHPFVVLLGILGGIAQFGVLGIILGPTIMAVGIVGLEIARKTWTVRPD